MWGSCGALRGKGPALRSLPFHLGNGELHADEKQLIQYDESWHHV